MNIPRKKKKKLRKIVPGNHITVKKVRDVKNSVHMAAGSVRTSNRFQFEVMLARYASRRVATEVGIRQRSFASEPRFNVDIQITDRQNVGN
jgi:hypothetical protein